MFIERWVLTWLTKGLLTKRDLLLLARKFEIRFTGEHWERETPGDQIGTVLINHVDPEELLRAVNHILKNRYPHAIAYGDAEKIYSVLQTMDIRAIARFYLFITKTGKFRKYVQENLESVRELSSPVLLGAILYEICKIPNSQALDKYSEWDRTLNK